jgi:hypothetical protein
MGFTDFKGVHNKNVQFRQKHLPRYSGARASLADPFPRGSAKEHDVVATDVVATVVVVAFVTVVAFVAVVNVVGVATVVVVGVKIQSNS